MNATVNDACIGCGLCAGTCPEVFSMGDDGFAHGGAVPEELLDQADRRMYEEKRRQAEV